VVSAVRRRWDLPLVVENDARASAVGECRGDESLVYVKVATGIGCGIVTDGVLQRGAHGAAGDIGHILMEPNGPRCRCGRRGCLAAFSSGHALLQQLAGESIASLDDLSAAAERSFPPVLAALDRASDQLARALAATVATVNPHRLVLGGVLGRLPHLTAQVNGKVRRDLLPRVSDQLVIEATSLGDTAGTRGLARLVVERVYAPETVDATIGAVPGGAP
jgi:predicted NBD/HSP70 family sugar kinase